jgi:hypothetical protein
MSVKNLKLGHKLGNVFVTIYCTLYYLLVCMCVYARVCACVRARARAEAEVVIFHSGQVQRPAPYSVTAQFSCLYFLSIRPGDSFKMFRNLIQNRKRAGKKCGFALGLQ